MKINYEDIIEKANERKERLQALAIYTADIQRKYQDLEASVQYFSNLLHRIKTLDNEGQLMLDKNITHLVSGATVSVKQLTQGSIRDEYNRTPLKDLVDMLSI